MEPCVSLSVLVDEFAVSIGKGVTTSRMLLP